MITEAVVTLQISRTSSKFTDLSLCIKADEEKILSISTAKTPQASAEDTTLPKIILETKRQLQEYLDGSRTTFDIPIDTNSGTEFQKKVWAALRDIPYGETRTYGEIAAAIGTPKGARAVGMGCNKNPILIITPCHRVIGASGALTGFACGLDIKKLLLEIETVVD